MLDIECPSGIRSSVCCQDVFNLQLLIRKEEPDPNQGPWYLYLQLPKYKRQQENSMKDMVRQKSEPSLRKQSHGP